MNNLVDKIIDTHKKLAGQNAKGFDNPRMPEVSMECKKVDSQWKKMVGKITYLVCKILPEANNAIQDFRSFPNPNEIHWKELDCIIGYLKKYKANVKLTLPK